MDERQVFRSLSAGRAAAGVAVLLFPRLFLRRFTGGEGGADSVFVARLFASRELALGLATLDALDREGAPLRLVELNMLVDGLDGLAGLTSGRALPPLGRLVTIAGATGAVLAAGRLRGALARSG